MYNVCRLYTAVVKKMVCGCVITRSGCPTCRIHLLNHCSTYEYAGWGACNPHHTGSRRWPIIEQRASFSRPIRLARASESSVVIGHHPDRSISPWLIAPLRFLGGKKMFRKRSAFFQTFLREVLTTQSFPSLHKLHPRIMWPYSHTKLGLVCKNDWRLT